MQSLSSSNTAAGPFDGTGAGDHDQPYVFGWRPRSNATGRFTTHHYLHLLVLRSRLEAGLFGTGDLDAAVEHTSSTQGVSS
jgi:hypothetical protein